MQFGATPKLGQQGRAPGAEAPEHETGVAGNVLPRSARRLTGNARAFVRLVGLAAWRGLVGFYRSNDLTFASSVAYYGLLSLFPFLLMILSLLGRIAAGDAERASVLAFVLRYFPGQLDFVTIQLDALEQARFTLGIAGSLLLIWASLGVFGALTSAIDHAWGVERQRSFVKHKVVSFLMLVAASLLLMIALILVSATGFVDSTTVGARLRETPGLATLTHLAFRWATTILLILVVGLIFYFVPNAKVRFRDVWVGALLTGLLWRGALQGFQWWVQDMTRFSAIHGSIAAVVVFLVWVYIEAVILLYGVEFTAAYARLRRHRPEEIPAAPSPRA